MLLLHWLALLLYALVVVLTMIAVLMDHRPPAKTMAWVMVLCFVPVVGIILYFFFGQNTRRERIISQRTLDQLNVPLGSWRSLPERERSARPTGTLAQARTFRSARRDACPSKNVQRSTFNVHRFSSLMALFAHQSMALPLQGTAVAVYTEGRPFFDALCKAILQAQHHVHLLTYIFEDDTVGRAVTEALINRAQAGVEVRLLYDDVGCWRVPSAFFEHLREGGVEVHSFMPVKFPAFTSKVNYRNHRKICVIDGSTGFIGGMNIAERYLSWRDTHLRLSGPIVNDLQHAFLVDWYFADRTLINDKKYYTSHPSPTTHHPSPITHHLLQLVTSSPTSRWPEIEQGYVRILMEAQRYVYMETPYFLPTEPVLFAMRTAAVAGVDVRLLLPLHGDSRLLEWASRSYVMEIVEAGVKVYFYRPRFNHSKLLVCDDQLASVGSANIDFRSFENNFEANMFIYDEQVASQLKQIFLDDQAQSLLLDDIAEMQNRPFIKKLWESLVRLLAPLL